MHPAQDAIERRVTVHCRRSRRYGRQHSGDRLWSRIAAPVYDAQSASRGRDSIHARLSVGTTVRRVIAEQIVRAVVAHYARKSLVDAVGIDDGKATARLGEVSCAAGCSMELGARCRKCRARSSGT
jgi:hypothetical protein